MTTISFTGDVAFSKHFQDHWQKEFLDEKILDFLRTSDHVVANVECPLTDSVVTSKMEIAHFGDPQAGTWFSKVGTDVWTLANNHVMDCGEAGMTDTIAAAHKNGAQTIGAGRNIDEASQYVSFDEEGGVGIFSVTYRRGEFVRATEKSAGCLLLDEPERIRKVIEEIKSKHRWCVVVSHGGDEFSHLPMPYTRKLYKSFLEMGADVVVGHHPHVVQNYETVGDKLILYSLGNFVFDTDYQRLQQYTEYGVLVKLCFSGDKMSWEYLPTRVNRTEQTMEVCEAPVIFSELTEKDYRLLWPLGAEKYIKCSRAARRYLVAEANNYNAFQWFQVQKKRIGLSDALCLYRGKHLSLLGLWKCADKALRDYLKQV